MTPDSHEITESLVNTGWDLGLQSVRVAEARPVARYGQFLKWLDSGHAGTMTYLHRQAARRGDPGLVLAGAKSIVSVSQSYYTGQMPEHIRCDPARGQIASYAWGDDYHDVLLEKVEALAAVIRELSPNAELRCYVDTGPVAERDHGARAGTGFIGKNTLLIHPRAGSYFFLGEILTTADLAPTPGEGMPSCGSCTRCLNACPTHAFPAAYVLNSNLCISYLTIEYRGIIPRVLRAKMGNHIFGCDDCQTCCPWNERFSRETDELRYQSELGRRAPELAVLAGMNATDYRAYFFGSAVTRCTHVMMLRNVAVALGNWGSAEAADMLERLARHESALVRAHAVWGLTQCASQNAVRYLREVHKSESDPLVLAEFSGPLEG